MDYPRSRATKRDARGSMGRHRTVTSRQYPGHDPLLKGARTPGEAVDPLKQAHPNAGGQPSGNGACRQSRLQGLLAGQCPVLDLRQAYKSTLNIVHICREV